MSTLAPMASRIVNKSDGNQGWVCLIIRLPAMEPACCHWSTVMGDEGAMRNEKTT